MLLAPILCQYSVQMALHFAPEGPRPTTVSMVVSFSVVVASHQTCGGIPFFMNCKPISPLVLIDVTMWQSLAQHVFKMAHCFVGALLFASRLVAPQPCHITGSVLELLLSGEASRNLSSHCHHLLEVTKDLDFHCGRRIGGFSQ